LYERRPRGPLVLMEDVSGEDRRDELAHRRALVLLEDRLAELAGVETLHDTEEQIDGVSDGRFVAAESRARDVSLAKGVVDGLRGEVGSLDREVRARREERIQEAARVTDEEPPVARELVDPVREVRERAHRPLSRRLGEHLGRVRRRRDGAL